jgi:drug/metabolite transporter (DMT)-like permease
MIQRSAQNKAIMSLVFVSAVWAVAAIVIKEVLLVIPPLFFLWIRFFFSSLVTAKSLKGGRHVLKKHLRLIILHSLLSAPLALGFLFAGIEKTGILNLSAAQVAAPIVTMVAASVFLKERISKIEKIGAVITIIGATIIGLEPILSGGSFNSQLAGNLFLAGFIIFDAASVLVLKLLMKSTKEAAFVIDISFTIGFLALTPIIFWVYTPPEILGLFSKVDLLTLLGVLYMALVSGNFAFTLRARAQKYLKVEEASLFGYLTPIMSAPLAVLFLGEKLTIVFLLGALFTALGVIVSESKHAPSLKLLLNRLSLLKNQ